jgi:pre-mRNA-splicing factor SYF2
VPKTAQEELRELEAAEEEEEEEERRRRPNQSAPPSSASEPPPAGGPAGTAGRAQKKLAELRARMGDSRRQNQTAVLAEQKREQREAARTAEGDAARLHASKKRRWEARLGEQGLSASQGHLLQTAEQAEQKYAKRDGADKRLESWEAAGEKGVYRNYERRVAHAQVSPEEYAAARAANPEFYRDADSLHHGQAPRAPRAAVERMAAEMAAEGERRGKSSRRRKHFDGKDVDSINRRNAHFNKKIERSLGKYTTEIKQNLERGTALPEPDS